MRKRFNIKNIICCNTVLFCLLPIAFSAAYGQPLSSEELINNANGYEDSEVVYQGEIIGDIMIRGDHAWVNINDGENALGIWADKNLAEGFLSGGYKSKGDWVEVKGEFHRSCPQHGGDMDIHANTLRTIQEGKVFEEKVEVEKKKISLILLGLLCLILILRRFSPVSRQR